jgi:hypothetical protein
MNIGEFVTRYFGSLLACQRAIKESHSLLPEGAVSNEGLYWISPKGKVVLVNTLDNEWKMGHEEYANAKWHCTLEEALEKGYIRVQAISPQYLFIDHVQQMVRSTQVAPLTGFFFTEEMAKIPYNQIAIERAGNNMITFPKGQNEQALQFAISGEVDKNAGGNETPKLPLPVEKKVAPIKDLRSTHPEKWRQAARDAGVSAYDYGEASDDSLFRKWIGERQKRDN